MILPIPKNRLTLHILVSLILLFALSAFGFAKDFGNNYEAADPKALYRINPSNLHFQEVADGFSQPLFVTHAGDGSNRIFVVERPGKIRIVKNGVVLALPFLDIQAIVNSSGGEQGLLSLAFHPDYQTNGQFYIAYTDHTNPVGTLVLARLTKSSTNPDLADPASRTTLLTIPEPYTNHNGGTLVFGPDSYLYWSTGDGGSGGDPQNNAQNLNSLLGKVLRLDVDSGSPYSIPTTNPFYTAGPSVKKEIWSYGLRNPWRISFDRLTGDLYIGDVGQGEYEEINWQPASSSGGENYGWRILEGAHCFSPATGCVEPNGYVAPVAEYPHTIVTHDDNGCSVTGGYVYRGSDFPALYGSYLYSDFCLGKIYNLYYDAKMGWVNNIIVDTPFIVSSFGEDEQGELYLADYFAGKIYQIQYLGMAVAIDEFGNPEFINDLPYNDVIDVTTATRASDDPSIDECNLKPGLASVWYSFTPVTNAPIFVDTFDSSYDTYIAIWRGSQGELAPVACNDDWDDKILQSGVGFNATANQTYMIEVAEFNGWIDSTFATYPVGTEYFSQMGRILNLNVVIGTISEVEISIGGIFLGGHIIPPRDAAQISFSGVNDGPVRVSSVDETDIISSEQVVWGVGFDEMMGYPANRLASEYVFPYYNNVAMNSQLRIGNTGDVPAEVDVYIGGVKVNATPYNIAVGGSVRVQYAGINNGPVRVVTETSGATILATMRVIWGTGYDELMGHPANRLTNEYVFPYYNNVAMNSQLRIGNTGDVPAEVDVYIGGVKVNTTSYNIAAGGNVRVQYAGLNNGPVRVVTETSGATILATMRVIWGTGYDELMGYPADQLTNEYYFPLYNNASLHTQLRVGNAGDVPAEVDVYIGGVKVNATPYNIAVGGSVRVQYTGINNGPVRVVTTTPGATILATERIIYGAQGYDEMMGYPGDQLTTEYLFPWYNNVAMQTQLNISVP